MMVKDSPFWLKGRDSGPYLPVEGRCLVGSSVCVELVGGGGDVAVETSVVFAWRKVLGGSTSSADFSD